MSMVSWWRNRRRLREKVLERAPHIYNRKFGKLFNRREVTMLIEDLKLMEYGFEPDNRLRQ